ncbi:MAG: prepilin-type N-terminal cleavage/methylation domain-containing protein [Desulforhopalus sp.]|nr:prepilin-type N-terminal cleavage/methylation domain-containing protein [Desulforhopalus sp.]
MRDDFWGAIKKQQGFTLVEMSIVLVIIGLILGAVSIGKDLQRDAEYDKIKQKFVDQWVQAYNTFYQRTGVVLGDSQLQPRIMVNGAKYTAADPISGGNMTAVTAPDAICQTAPGPDMTRGSSGTDPSLHNLMDQLGIRMPPGRAEGSEDRYVYLDSNGNPQEVQICFQWNNPGNPEGSGNVMVLTGLTPDLARSLDQSVDGKPDAREGLFRQQDVANGTPGGPGVEWDADNTQAYSSTGPGANQDEDQIKTVVAIYKMNQ